MSSTIGLISADPPLFASPEMRQALDDYVLPISGDRQTGDVIGLGAHYRLFAEQVSTTGGIMPVYTIWTSGTAGPVAHGGHETPNIACRKDGAPVMHSQRPVLSGQISRHLEPLVSADIQSFDLICASEGVVIYRRGTDTRSTDIIGIEKLEFIGAIPWDFCSNHQRLAFTDYVDIHLAGNL